MGIVTDTIERGEAFVNQNDDDANDGKDKCGCHKDLMKSEP